jgi:hypothetical protein
VEIMDEEGDVVGQARGTSRSGLHYLLFASVGLALVGVLGMFLSRALGLIWWIGGFLGLTLALVYLQVEPGSRGEGVESRQFGVLAWTVVAVAAAAIAWNSWSFSQWVAG